MNTVEQHKDKLVSDLNHVIRDAEDLLKNSEQQAGEGFKAARARFENTLRNAKSEVARIEDIVINRGKEAAHKTDVYVKENPWQSAGIAAGVGLLIGWLIGRSK